MKLKDRVNLWDHHHPADINWHQMEEAEIISEVNDDGVIYILIKEVDDGHALYVEAPGGGGEDLYLDSFTFWVGGEYDDLPEEVAAWLKEEYVQNCHPQPRPPTPAGKPGRGDQE